MQVYCRVPKKFDDCIAEQVYSKLSSYEVSIDGKQCLEV